MKKFFVLVLIIGFLLISSAEAVTQLSSTYVVRNNSGSNLMTAVSTSTIIPGIHKVVGYTVKPMTSTSAGAWVTLYKGGRAESDVIGESEVLVDTSESVFFGYPKAVREGGLTIYQSPYSVVLIEYTR